MTVINSVSVSSGPGASSVHVAFVAFGSEVVGVGVGSEPSSVEVGSELSSVDVGSDPSSVEVGSDPSSVLVGSDPSSVEVGVGSVELVGTEPSVPVAVALAGPSAAVAVPFGGLSIPKSTETF
jgi:hypothetical protein